MTWSSFTIVVTVCYAIYYGGNILYDLVRPASVAKDGEQTEVLRFTEETAPVSVKGPENDDDGKNLSGGDNRKPGDFSSKGNSP